MVPPLPIDNVALESSPPPFLPWTESVDPSVQAYLSVQSMYQLELVWLMAEKSGQVRVVQKWTARRVRPFLAFFFSPSSVRSLVWSGSFLTAATWRGGGRDGDGFRGRGKKETSCLNPLAP